MEARHKAGPDTKQSGASGRWPCAAGERREKAEALWQELGAVDLGAELSGPRRRP